MDWPLAVGGAVVGVVVGMTGMGGGALMTPMLVLFFGVQPLAAVSNDLVVTAFMKPVGGAVHLRKGTVHLDLVRWLMVGSVPAAFGGVVVLKFLVGDSATIQDVIRSALGAALLLAATGIAARAYLPARSTGQVATRTAPSISDRGASTGSEMASPSEPQGSAETVVVRRRATVVLGALAGLVVGLTSVGSGSLVVVALLTLYPALPAARLVGTDIVQAIPLVTAAALAHVIFGDFQMEVAAPLLIGSVPGIWAGAHLSTRAPDGLVKWVLAIVLTASALKLFSVPTVVVGWFLAGAAVVGPSGWLLARTLARRRSVPHSDGETVPEPVASAR
jgi:uncharacterized membrane protein YfcA